jgi:hypothetical protein
MVAGAAATNRVLRGTLFNRTAQRESPPAFEVTLFDGEKTKAQEVVMPGGEIDALNSKGAAADPTKDRRAFVVPDVRHGVPLLKVLSVRQVLDWRSVPVKRVDRLVLGEEARKQNDRIKIIPLKPYNFARKSTLPADQTAAPATAPEGPMMPGLGGGQDAGRLSPNHKIDLNRYYETETEVRRVPVALSLIVDEQHIATVLTAFANSRLRVQVTQEVWTRLAHGIGKPTLAGHAPAGAGGGTGAAGAGGAGGGVNVPAMNKAVDDDTLQVELQIFGLATIYEDPDAPERIEKEKAGGGAAAAGTGPAGK